MTVICFYTLYLVCIRFVKVERKIYIEIKSFKFIWGYGDEGITPQEGFTLVELIVTIAVMAIIAMMAAPSMSNLLESKRLDTNQRDLISTLSEAKSQAVLGRQNVSVNLNSAASNTATLLNWQPTSNNTLTLKI